MVVNKMHWSGYNQMIPMQSNWKDSIIIAVLLFGKGEIEMHCIWIINAKAVPKAFEIS